jgi:hypothetical protein
MSDASPALVNTSGTTGSTTYVAFAKSLSTMPALNALALIVTVELLTLRGPEHAVEEEVGIEPSTV